MGTGYAAYPTFTQAFGPVAVSSIGTPVTVTFSLTGVTAQPATAIGGVDFTAGTLSCNAGFTSCSASVTFAPKSVGLKQDALVLKSSAGAIIAAAFLNGLGTAAVLRTLPASLSTFAGNGIWAHVDGAATAASFRNPQGVAVDLKGNIYVADSLNHQIRQIAASNSAVSTVAGNGSAGYSGDGGAALSAMLNTPTGIAVDAGGNLFIADEGNGLIRRVDAVTNLITTVAGGGSSTLNGVSATTAALSGPNDVAVDTSGNIYIADSYHSLVRQVSAATGLISTVAGGGSAAGTDGYGDGGAATSAGLIDPTGLTLDAAGNLYIADTGNCLIRKVAVSSQIITAVAGNGSCSDSGNGTAATATGLNSPSGVRLDAAGNIYIAEQGASTLRMVEAASGVILSIAGNGSAGYAGDGEVATSGSLSAPTDVAVDRSGNLIVADYGNNVIRKVTLTPPTLNFPTTNVGLTSSPVQTIELNTGNLSTTLSSVNVPANFVEVASGATDCAASLSLAVGAACNTWLAFAPLSSGAITGTLTVTSAASTASINLSATAAVGTPAVTLSATSLSFGTTAVGASVTQTVTLTNGGTGVLSSLTLGLSGANAGDFSLTTTCTATLAASASCVTTIAFSPALAGSRTATLSFNDGLSNSPQTVSLSGIGTGGPISALSTTSLSFASQPVASVSATQALTLSNTGTSLLPITGIALTGTNSSDFVISSTTCGASVAAGASCTLNIAFAPTVQGTRTATLTFVLTASHLYATVSLSGIATAAVTVSTGGGGTGTSGGGGTGTTGSTGGSGGITANCVSALTPTSAIYPMAGASDSMQVTASSGCSWAATTSVSWVTLAAASGTNSGTLAFTVAANPGPGPRTGVITVGAQVFSLTQVGSGLLFVPMSPCRVLDTRGATGTFGGPVMQGGATRDFPLPQGVCGIPSNAEAYAMNVTVVPVKALGFLNIWPSGLAQPLGSILNSDGRVKSNAAIIPAGTGGGISAYASDDTQMIIDVSGYFVSAIQTSALAFYPITPCRVVDTRVANGDLGSPSLVALQPRSFPVLSSTCNIPAAAQAYSFNFTAVPKGKQIGYLSTWPTGQAQPLASTLNDPTGTVVANAAIVQAGTGGAISVFATDAADIIIDINGYFGAAQSGGLSLYNLSPCRALDTRANGGAPLDGPLVVTLIGLNQCGTIPSSAQAFVLNATVVPEPTLGYLTLWPDGSAQPLVSTLNAFDGAVSSNLAIVPANAGAIDAFTSNPSHLILDLFCYFGP